MVVLYAQTDYNVKGKIMPKKSQSNVVSMNRKMVNDAPIRKFSSFLGIDNVTKPSLLNPRYLQRAINFDNYKDGHIELRPGQTMVSAGATKRNIFSNLDRSVCLFMDGGALKRLNPDESISTIASGFNPNLPMRYCDADARIFLTNQEQIGYFKDGGYVDSTQFTDKLDFYKVYAFAGDEIEYGLGRLWIVKGDTVWYSDGHRPLQFDLTHNFMRFASAVTLFRTVINGLWVSDNYIRFLAGTNPKAEMRMITKAEYPAIRNANTRLTGDEVGEEGMADLPICFMTTQGVAIGGVDGSYKNLTEKKYKIPVSSSIGSAFYNPQIGLNKVIFVLQS
jgi:hypothetical protein